MDLSHLPPPPKNQQGITLDDMTNLPPPPTGQQGVSLEDLSQNTPIETPSTSSKAIQGVGKAAKENLVDPFTSRLDKIDYGNQNLMSNGLQTMAAGIGGAYDVLGKGVGAAFDYTTQGIDKTFGTNTNQGLKNIESKVGGALSEGVKNTIAALPPERVQQVTSFIEKHPEVSKDLGSILAIFSEGKVGQLGNIAKELKTGTQATVNAVKQGSNAIGRQVSNAKEIVSPILAKVGKGLGSMAEKQTPLLTKVVKSVVNTVPEKLQVARANARKSLENKYEELFTGQSPSKQVKYKNAQEVTNAKNKAGTEGLPPQTILSERGIIPKQSGSRLTTLEQADKLRTETKPLHEANSRALKEVEQSVPKTNIDEVERRAIENITNESKVSSSDRNTLESKIRNEFNAVRGDTRYGNEVGITKLDEIKGQQWAKTKFDTAVPQLDRDVHYAIAKAYQKIIEETASKAGFKEVAQLNRHIGDILEASKSLEGLNGKILKGGQLGKYVYTALGAGAGKTLLGKIIGGVGGNAIAEVLISNSVAGPVKRALLKDLQKTKPEAYKKAMKWLNDKSLEREGRLALPAGDFSKQAILMGAKRAQTMSKVANDFQQNMRQAKNTKYLEAPKQMPIQMGAGKAKTYKTQLINAKKGLVGTDPKSGRFIRTYLSE